MCLFIVYPSIIIAKSVFPVKVEGTLLQLQVAFLHTQAYYYERSARFSGVCFSAFCWWAFQVAYPDHREDPLHIFIIMSLMSPPFIGAYSLVHPAGP